MTLARRLTLRSIPRSRRPTNLKCVGRVLLHAGLVVMQARRHAPHDPIRTSEAILSAEASMISEDQATAAAAFALLGDFRVRGSAVFAPFGVFTITSINAFWAST